MTDALAFTLAAVALLGSPGPAIAALLAIGRAQGFRASLPFFLALQLGLAIAAGLSAAGLVSLLTAAPAVQQALMLVALAYLVWLAWKIGAAPVGEPQAASTASSLGQGFLLGIANPKAYLAFASLIASFVLIPRSGLGDGVAKWSILVVVMITVDVAWLAVGAALGGLKLSPGAERAMNLVMAATILAAAALAFL
ncbi:LysE family transporter [Phenylobacterium sp.]|uniref:LysE family translocator n=1 Tax=Phenylobacterium sp. TaxID=1871053 RepID=UPI0028122788|nr:LysE family transporter [Phenylobacterium sp.]